jgi:hypothetical protein
MRLSNKLTTRERRAKIMVRRGKMEKMSLTRSVVAKRPKLSSTLRCFTRSLRRASFRVGCLGSSFHL